MKVTVYTKPQCQPCRGTKIKLKKLKIPFEELSAPDHADYLTSLNYSQLPVVVVDYGEGVTTTWSDYRPDLIDQIKDTM